MAKMRYSVELNILMTVFLPGFDIGNQMEIGFVQTQIFRSRLIVR